MSEYLPIKKGQQIECDIESLAFGGLGVSRADDFVIFVRSALPGQKVIATVTKKKQNYAEARVVSILRQSAAAVQQKCLHFGDCGGCLLQNLRYEDQVNEKKKQVHDILSRMGGEWPAKPE